VQAGDPGRLLEHHAPLGRLGGDYRGDAPLADQRRAVGTRGGVGKDQPDILGAHVATVDAIGGAGAALDPADDFELAAPGIVGVGLGGQRHFGKGACRPRRAAGEDHVVHPGAAHRLGRRLAHDPAQRLEQVGLAAAVGADDSRQPRFDAQFGRLDEALETGQLQAPEMHAPVLSPRLCALSARRRAAGSARAAPRWRRRRSCR
jgi:hypothetical protein